MKIFYGIAQCLLCIGLMSCDNSNSNSSNKTAATAGTAVEKNTGSIYVIGTERSFPPFALIGGSGEISGYDTELIKAVAEKQGLNVEIEVFPWGDWLPTLESGRVDVWMSGIAITPERQQQVGFSSPYMNRSTIAITKDSISSLDKQTIEGKRIAVQSGTPDFDYVTSLIVGTEAQIVPVVSNYIGITSLTTDKADILVGNDKVIKYHLNQHPEVSFKVIPLEVLNTDIAFATKKDRAELLVELNEGLKKVRADKALYESLNNKWFGEPDVYTAATPAPLAAVAVVAAP